MTSESTTFDLEALTLAVIKTAGISKSSVSPYAAFAARDVFDGIYLRVRDVLRPVVDAANAAQPKPAPAPPEPPLGDMATIAPAPPALPDAEAAATSPTESLVRPASESPYLRFVQDMARCHTALHQMEEEAK
jgi:hypothetical protein